MYIVATGTNARYLSEFPYSILELKQQQNKGSILRNNLIL